MRRWSGFITSLGFMALASSCIFQNDPVGPNSIPSIISYYPLNKYIHIETPNSCLFTIHAVDRDADQLVYEFVILDSLNGIEVVDSVLCRSDTLLFEPVEGGIYLLQGRVCDGSSLAFREWIVTVVAVTNEPPKISWRSPDQDSISCVRGSRLEFRIGVTDDNPNALWYTYLAGDSIVKTHSRTPELVYDFWRNGVFTLVGKVWDGQYDDSTAWHVTVKGDPDTIAPGPVNDLQGWTGEDIGSIRLAWTAPGDDSTYGRVTGYKIRTYTNPILTEKDWNDASEKECDIQPVPAGMLQEVVLRGNLNPGTYLYVTVRAFDEFYRADFGELSPLGNCIHLLVRGVDAKGRVINAWNDQGVEGFYVTSEGISDTTDASGSYFLPNLPKYASVLWARDELDINLVGNFYDLYWLLYNLDWHFTKDLYVVPVLGLQNTVEPDDYGGRFYSFFKIITNTTGEFGSSTVHKGWNHWPITVYNPCQVIEGVFNGQPLQVDLQQAARGAMDEWEDMTDLDLFEEIDDPNEADVKIAYFDEDSNHRYIITAFNPDGTPAKKEVWIYLKHDMVPVLLLSHLVFAHELGHVLGLGHSINLGHVMMGLTLPQVHHVTTDEANAVRILYFAPPVLDCKYIVEK